MEILYIHFWGLGSYSMGTFTFPTPLVWPSPHTRPTAVIENQIMCCFSSHWNIPEAYLSPPSTLEYDAAMMDADSQHCHIIEKNRDKKDLNNIPGWLFSRLADPEYSYKDLIILLWWIQLRPQPIFLFCCFFDDSPITWLIAETLPL